MVLHAKCRRAVHVVINTVTHQAVKTVTFSIAYPRRFGEVRLIEQIFKTYIVNVAANTSGQISNTLLASNSAIPFLALHSCNRRATDDDCASDPNNS